MKVEGTFEEMQRWAKVMTNDVDVAEAVAGKNFATNMQAREWRKNAELMGLIETMLEAAIEVSNLKSGEWQDLFAEIQRRYKMP